MNVSALAIAPKISLLYVGLNISLLLLLALYVVWVRYRTKTYFGDDGDGPMYQAMRVQANAVEYIPAALVMLVVLELMGCDGRYVHLLGIMLTLGRVAHAWGLGHSTGASIGRGLGTLLTWLTFAWGAGLCLYGFYFGV